MNNDESSKKYNKEENIDNELIDKKKEEKTFKIVTESFEGPFEKLLILIEKKKLEITKVSLAEVTDEFVKYVEERIRKQNFNFKETASFIQSAAILLLIKSKILIPTFVLEDNEEENIDDLEKKLKIYKIFSDISKNISEDFYVKILYKKKFIKKRNIEFRPSENLNFQNILLSLDEILKESPKKKEYEKKQIEKQMTLSEVIESISNRVRTFVKANFMELVVGNNPKEIAISFLAVLELFRQDVVLLKQDENFGDIIVELKD